MAAAPSLLHLPPPLQTLSPRIPFLRTLTTLPQRVVPPLIQHRGFRGSSLLPMTPPRGASRGAPVDEAAASEVREAVAELLVEYGADKSDAVFIAARAPKYAEMLVDGVKELDEFGMWDSWSSGMEEEIRVAFAELGFKRKVYYMGRRKGDRGLLPFLESIGVKFSSAKLIVSYISSQTLSNLIEKAKYLKEILFSTSGYEVLIGRNAKRMMKNLSIPPDEGLQNTLSFYEKMEARYGGLKMLADETSAFPSLIESFPRILLCSRDEHLEPLVVFLELSGLSKGKIASVLLSYPPIFFLDIEKDIKPRLNALYKAGVEERDIGDIMMKYPWILSTCIQANYDEILALFSREKISKAIVDLAVKSWPHILGCSTQRMISTLEQFDGLGVYNNMLAPVISSSPQLLLRKPEELLEVVTFFEEIGFDHITIGRILRRSPEIFAASVENTLRKKVHFLVDFGIPKDCLPRVIRKYPELLLLDVDRTLLPRLKYLMSLGLSSREVCSMIFRFSPLLGYSAEQVIKPKLDFLLTTMQKPLKEIVDYPRYFSYSLEKKIRPRFWVLKNRHIECSLKDMLDKNDDAFAQEHLGIGRLLVTPAPTAKDGLTS